MPINELTLNDGEMVDLFGDMLTPAELIEALDRHCWQEQLLGVYLILRERFEHAPGGDAAGRGT